MNKFAVANIEDLDELNGPGASFYSVRFEDKKINEFERWTSAFLTQPHVKDEFDDLYGWLDEMAQHGIREEMLRNERAAQALPPPVRYLEVRYRHNLRPYCKHVTNQAMFLFNGGIKTKNTAQECPNVSPHFERANKLAKEIDKMVRSGTIEINSESGIILRNRTISIPI